MGHAGKEPGLCLGNIDGMLLLHIHLSEIVNLLNDNKCKQESKSGNHRDCFPDYRNIQKNNRQFNQTSYKETDKTYKCIAIRNCMTLNRIKNQDKESESCQNNQNQIGRINQSIEWDNAGKMQEWPYNGIQNRYQHNNKSDTLISASLYGCHKYCQRQRHHQTEYKAQQSIHMINPEDKTKQR